MLCRDLMKTDVRCVTPETTIAVAAALMRDEQAGFLPICDTAGNVLGTITDRDIAIRVVAEYEPPDRPVDLFMTRDVIACQSGESLDTAQEAMAEFQVSRILCVDENGLLEGVISLSDIAQVAGDGAASATLRNVSAREARA